MTIPANHIIAQGMLLYRKVPAGQIPIVFVTLCNCASSPRDRTARFVQNNRHLFITPQQFKDNQWV